MRPKRALLLIASSRRLRALLLAAVALGVAGLGIATYATHLFKALEGDTVDARFSVRGTDKPGKNIVLVKISDDTLSTLHKQWPFPRADHGKVLEAIRKDHPAAIAYDVQFSQQTSDKDAIAFLNAINDTNGRTVFASSVTDQTGNVPFLGSDAGTKLMHEVGAQPASALFPPDPGGVIRRMSYKLDGLRTLAVVTAEVATHKKIKPSLFGNGTHWIDYAGPGGTYPSVDFADVYNGKVKPGFFHNKIVVIGVTAESLHDISATPTDSLMPGAEIQANAISTVLKGLPLSSAPGWINIVLIIIAAVAVPLVSLRVGPTAAGALGLGLAAALAVGTQLAFNSGTVTSFVYPMGALILSAGGALAVQLLTEAFERIRTRDIFARFVPENVVDEVLANADGLRLGGVQREATVMFTDIRGFTTLSENISPSQVIEVLNHYLSEMSDAILNHGGTLVSYEGDGIFAVFGAPLEQADHADRALAAAREMLDMRLPRFNAWLRDEGLSDGVRIGIGLNSGPVMSGQVGSERRVEYAAVGDTTNTGSRIQGLTKGTPHQLFFSGATKAALVNPPEDAIYFGDTEIRGRLGHMELWALAGDTLDEKAPAQEEKEPLQVSGPNG